MTLATLFLCLTSVLTLGVPACLDFNEICKLFSLLLILLLHRNSPNIQHSHTYTNTHTLTRKLVFLYSCVVLLRFVFFACVFPPVYKFSMILSCVYNITLLLQLACLLAWRKRMFTVLFVICYLLVRLRCRRNHRCSLDYFLRCRVFLLLADWSSLFPSC